MKRKIAIMKKSTLNDAEIEAFMDFDSLVNKKQSGAARAKWPYYTAGIALVVLTGAWIWWKSQEVDARGESTLPSRELIAGPESEPITPGKSLALDSVNYTSAQPEKAIAKPKPEERPVENKAAAQPEFTGYKQAEPNGGYEKLYHYFSAELHYPEEAVRDSVQGVVVVDFVINESGKPEQVQIQQSLRADCDKEAVRVIENMAPWSPAVLNGRPVSARVSVPLTFQIVQPK
ncbi:MAG: TonB family protein [Cyclobacteriaceae bacterium]|nr:TonB family protein [Cyclobacteriaceae bacterium]